MCSKTCEYDGLGMFTRTVSIIKARCLGTGFRSLLDPVITALATKESRLGGQIRRAA